MMPYKLTYGEKGFSEIKKFLDENYDKGYALSIFNINSVSAVDFICDFKDMLDCIRLVSSMEHEFPAWIAKNELTDSYVVGMNFTKGYLETSSVYTYTAEGVKKLQ